MCHWAEKHNDELLILHMTNTGNAWLYLVEKNGGRDGWMDGGMEGTLIWLTRQPSRIFLWCNAPNLSLSVSFSLCLCLSLVHVHECVGSRREAVCGQRS